MWLSQVCSAVINDKVFRMGVFGKVMFRGCEGDSASWLRMLNYPVGD